MQAAITASAGIGVDAMASQHGEQEKKAISHRVPFLVVIFDKRQWCWQRVVVIVMTVVWLLRLSFPLTGEFADVEISARLRSSTEFFFIILAVASCIDVTL